MRLQYYFSMAFHVKFLYSLYSQYVIQHIPLFCHGNFVILHLISRFAFESESKT